MMKKLTLEQFIQAYKKKEIMDCDEIWDKSDIDIMKMNEEELLEIITIIFDGLNIISAHTFSLLHLLLSKYHEYHPREIPLLKISEFLENKVPKEIETKNNQRIMRKIIDFLKNSSEVYMPKCEWNELTYQDYIKFDQTHLMVDPDAALAYYYEMSDEKGYDKLRDHIYQQGVQLSEDDFFEIFSELTQKDDLGSLQFAQRHIQNLIYNFQDEGIQINKVSFIREMDRILEMENVKADALLNYNMRGLKYNSIHRYFKVYIEDLKLMAPPHIHYLNNDEYSKLALSSLKDYKIFEIDGNKCKTEEGLFGEFQKVLKFPDFFHNTWDSFNQCLIDIHDWLPAKGYVVMINNYSNCLIEQEDKSMDHNKFTALLEKSSCAYDKATPETHEDEPFARDSIPFHALLIE